MYCKIIKKSNNLLWMVLELMDDKNDVITLVQFVTNRINYRYIAYNHEIKSVISNNAPITIIIPPYIV